MRESEGLGRFFRNPLAGLTHLANVCVERNANQVTPFSPEDQSKLLMLLQAANPCETDAAGDESAVLALEEFKTRAIGLLEESCA